MMAKPIDVEAMRKMFEYLNGKLFWAETYKHSGSGQKGSVAGSVNKAGYMQTVINRSAYQNHRIIYAIIHGDCPQDMRVDHIDGNKLNNKIENLRLATHSQNSQNRKGAQRNNSTGLRGVCSPKRLANTKKPYMAQIVVNGVNTYLGMYASEAEASAIHQQARIKYFGEFA